jgi:hypothetical protein
MKNSGVYVIRTTDYYGVFYEAIKQGTPVREYPDTYKTEEKLKLKSGMKLLVRWPDGKIVSETIKLEKGHEGIRVDMMSSGEDDAETHVINAVLKHHGVEVLIPLERGTQVRLSRR